MGLNRSHTGRVIALPFNIGVSGQDEEEQGDMPGGDGSPGDWWVPRALQFSAASLVWSDDENELPPSQRRGPEWGIGTEWHKVPLYADDILIYLRNHEQTLSDIYDLLHIFAEMSGL